MAQKNNLTIQVLSITGGILTAFFFLGFLILTSILRSELSCLIFGSILIIATLSANRILTKPFLDAMNITCYIAGCALVSFGMNRNIAILFILLLVISILTLLLSKGFILPFLAAILFNIALFGEITHLFSSSYPLQIATVPVVALFLLMNLFELKLLTNGSKKFLIKYPPIHSGIFVTCLILLGSISINYLTSGTSNWILSVFMWAGLLVMVQRIMQVMEVKKVIHQICIYALCLIVCIPTIYAPYLSGSLLLILICYHYGYKTECAASLLLFIYTISKYYYDLNLTLLVKSITLFFTGIALIIAWYYFTQKRTQHEKI